MYAILALAVLGAWRPLMNDERYLYPHTIPQVFFILTTTIFTATITSFLMLWAASNYQAREQLDWPFSARLFIPTHAIMKLLLLLLSCPSLKTPSKKRKKKVLFFLLVARRPTFYPTRLPPSNYVTNGEKKGKSPAKSSSSSSSSSRSTPCSCCFFFFFFLLSIFLII